MEPEVCSLEDDDYGNLFITQETSNVDNIVQNMDKSDDENDSVFGIDAMDFSSPNVSVVKGHNAMYSDISDVEDFEPNDEKQMETR